MIALMWLFNSFVGCIIALEMQNFISLSNGDGYGSLGLSGVHTDQDVEPFVFSSSASASSSPSAPSSTPASSLLSASSSSPAVSSFLQQLQQSDSYTEMLNRAYKVYTDPEIFFNMERDNAARMGVSDPNALANMWIQFIASAGDVLTPLGFAKINAAVIERILRESGFPTDRNREELVNKSIDIIKKSTESLPPLASDLDYAQALSNAYVEMFTSFPNMSSDQMENFFQEEMRSLKV